MKNEGAVGSGGNHGNGGDKDAKYNRRVFWSF